jgi:hypothetical protein
VEARTRTGDSSKLLGYLQRNKPFSESQFVKQCILDVAEAVCPEYRAIF